MSNVQLVCNDTKSLESLYYWVAYVICHTISHYENVELYFPDWCYWTEWNLKHLESDPKEPIVCRSYNPLP